MRLFSHESTSPLVETNAICEDIWTEHYLPRPFYDVEPTRSLIEQGAELIVNLSASPFSLHKPAVRH
jgi:NAD+ synthase (glutamine-hydrolysing)